MQIKTQTAVIATFLDPKEDGQKNRTRFTITWWQGMYVLHSGWQPDFAPANVKEYSEGLVLCVKEALKRGLYEVNDKGEPLI
jgi:hypothetical protein